jgi:hypothetical protein
MQAHTGIQDKTIFTFESDIKNWFFTLSKTVVFTWRKNSITWKPIRAQRRILNAVSKFQEYWEWLNISTTPFNINCEEVNLNLKSELNNFKTEVIFFSTGSNCNFTKLFIKSEFPNLIVHTRPESYGHVWILISMQTSSHNDEA